MADTTVTAKSKQVRYTDGSYAREIEEQSETTDSMQELADQAQELDMGYGKPKSAPTLQECLEWLDEIICTWEKTVYGHPGQAEQQTKFRTAIRAQLEAGAARQWRPIETAPRDEKAEILAIDIHGNCWLGRMFHFPNPEYGWHFTAHCMPRVVTHWMPLPEPPEALTQAIASGLIAEGNDDN